MKQTSRAQKKKRCDIFKAYFLFRYSDGTRRYTNSRHNLLFWQKSLQGLPSKYFFKASAKFSRDFARHWFIVCSDKNKSCKINLHFDSINAFWKTVINIFLIVFWDESIQIAFCTDSTCWILMEVEATMLTQRQLKTCCKIYTNCNRTMS